MNWDAIGAIAEFVGSVAVVVTLIYLTSQLRQNTKALRSTGYASVHDQENDLLAEMARDPVLARLDQKAAEGIEHLNEAERLQWSWLGRRIVFMFHYFHYQHQLGGVDDAVAAGWDNAWRIFLNNHKGVRQTFDAVKPSISKSFVAHSETLIDRIEDDDIAQQNSASDESRS